MLNMTSDYRLKNSRKAFTLVEILVVIAVIGLLSSIIFAITRGADEQGRIAKGLYFSQHLHNSLGSYAAGIWSFDEGSGTAANDISGWDNNGTLVNTPTWRCASIDTNYTPSGQGCSLEFAGSGSGQYIRIGNTDTFKWMHGAENPSGFKFTLELWIKRLAGGPDGWIFGTVGHNFSNVGVFLYLNGGTSIRMGIAGGSGTAVFQANDILTVPSDGRFHHLAWTYDHSLSSGNSKLYFDGDLKHTGNKGSGTVSTANSTYVPNIGAVGNGSSLIPNSMLDDVRIYATSLTSTQIESQYYASLGRLLDKDQITKQEHQERLVINK